MPGVTFRHEPGALQQPSGPHTALPEVVWHQLNTADVGRAKENYGALVGWGFEEPRVLAGVAELHPFAWHSGRPEVGSMSDIAQRPGVHPHWLFHFRVARLEPALQAVRAGGGLTLPVVVLPNGDRVAACDDAQGAAFGLFEQRGRE